MLKLRIAKYDGAKESNMPVVRLVITDDDGFIFDEGYLIPYRRYCFQVCQNLAIGDDAGASPIIEYQRMLNNLAKDYREEVKDLLHGQVVLAIEQWLLREKNRIKIRFGKETDIDRTECYFGTGDSLLYKKTVMDEFVNDCYEWIFVK